MLITSSLFQFSSVAQLCPTLCNSMDCSMPGLPVHHQLTPRAYSNSCPLSWWCFPTISSSVVPFSSCLQSFPVSGSFQMSQFLTSGGQSIGVSASASVLPKYIQDWSHLGWTGLISLQSNDSQESSPTPQFKSINSSALRLLYGPTLWDPMDCNMTGLPGHRQLLEITQTHVHWVGDAIQPSHPLLSPSPAFNLSQYQGLFKWVCSSHQGAKILEFHLQHQSFQWIFRTDFL